MELHRVSAAVLAGGLSSRMGRDKAALPFGGGTLLAHQARRLQSLGVAEVLLSGWDEPIPGTRAVPDVFPRCGPLGGVHACLQAASSDAVLFLSVDVPLLPAETLRALVAAHTGGITLLGHDGVTEPLIGVYDAALAADAEALLRAGQGAPRLLAERAPCRAFPYEGDAALLLNCNTPDDYRIALESI